jgi:hypothetical protein
MNNEDKGRYVVWLEGRYTKFKEANRELEAHVEDLQRVLREVNTELVNEKFAHEETRKQMQLL